MILCPDRLTYRIPAGSRCTGQSMGSSPPTCHPELSLGRIPRTSDRGCAARAVAAIVAIAMMLLPITRRCGARRLTMVLTCWRQGSLCSSAGSGMVGSMESGQGSLSSLRACLSMVNSQVYVRAAVETGRQAVRYLDAIVGPPSVPDGLAADGLGVRAGHVHRRIDIFQSAGGSARPIRRSGAPARPGRAHSPRPLRSALLAAQAEPCPLRVGAPSVANADFPDAQAGPHPAADSPGLPDRG